MAKRKRETRDYESEKIKLAKLINSNAENIKLVEKPYTKTGLLSDQNFKSVELDGEPTGYAICKGQCSSKPVKYQDGMPISTKFYGRILCQRRY